MKNKSRFFGVLLLVAIYSFAIGVSAHSNTFPSQQITSNSDSQSSYSPLKFIVSNHTSQVGSTNSTVNTLPVKEFKNHVENLWALVNAFELRNKTESAQYTKFWSSLLINYRKTDLIFPFHYFW